MDHEAPAPRHLHHRHPNAGDSAIVSANALARSMANVHAVADPNADAAASETYLVAHVLFVDRSNDSDPSSSLGIDNSYGLSARAFSSEMMRMIISTPPHTNRHSLPQVAGASACDGLASEIETLRDSLGCGLAAQAAQYHMI